MLSAHSSFALFIITLGVGAEALAFASSRLALSYSEFSDSSFTAANQISSEFGLAWKAKDNIPLAAGTSPYKNRNKLKLINKLKILKNF